MQSNAVEVTPKLSALLFHCTFNEDGTVTSYMHDHDDDIEELPHVYVVCVGDTNEKRKIFSGFVVKTTLTHKDTGFHELLNGVVAHYPSLNRDDVSEKRLIPAVVGINAPGALTEKELEMIVTQQYMKHHYFGSV